MYASQDDTAKTAVAPYMCIRRHATRGNWKAIVICSILSKGGIDDVLCRYIGTSCHLSAKSIRLLFHIFSATAFDIT